MVIVLKGLAGPYQNKYFRIAAGMGLGRRQGDIILEEDSTISSLHGRVISLPSGLLCLKDAGSQNQFLLQSRRVESVTLSEGTVFQVGQSVFQVLKISEKEAQKLNLEKNWKDVVFDALENNKNLNLPKVSALNPSVRVDCIQGASADLSWYLGFGPRLFGPLSPDIEILEKDSGDISFEIAQSPQGPILLIHSQNVSVNQKSIQEKLLEEGDEIQVGSSLFKIRLE